MNIRKLEQLLSSIILALIFSSPAKSIEASIVVPANSNKTCQQAISFVGKELASKGAFVPFNSPVAGRLQPEVFINDGNFSQYYYGYPANRPQMVRFRLTGDPERIWYGVMNSPHFLTNLASQIMSACPQVGMVQYQHFYEGHVPVGYFSDGTARAFTPVPYDDPRKEQWGYYYSP